MKCFVASVIAALYLGAGTMSADGTFRKAWESPSKDAHPGAFWYWMNGNVTEEGIKADMKAFHDVGVRWVHQMDIGVLPPATDLTYHSDEWYRLIGVALQQAEEYGINMHFNGPGWAVSGGPWITPEHSMKELAWTEARVTGGQKAVIRLGKPTSRLGFYKDIAVLAFPSAEGDDWASMKELSPVVRNTDGNILDGSAMFDGDYTTESVLPTTFEVVLNRRVQAKAMMLRAASKNRAYKAKLEGWDYNTGSFRSLGEMASVDPGPFSPLICDMRFGGITTDRFRITMDNGARPTALVEELCLYGEDRIMNWVRKSGCGTKDVTNLARFSGDEGLDIISKNDIIDLTGKMSAEGEITWNAPEGNWTVLRIGYTPTGNKIYPPTVGGDGLEVDKMSKESAEYQYRHAIRAIAEHVGPELAKAMKFQHVDSYEAGWQTWTEGFDTEFSKRNGYDIISWLPAMTGRIISSTVETEQFLWDMRKTISDMFIDNFYEHSAEIGREDGLKFSNEPYGGPFNFLNLGKVADVPMIEFWCKTLFPGERKVNFHGVNAGRTNGRKVIASETFTSGWPKEKWDNYPYSIKALGDYVYCCGVNRFIMHVSAMQPFVNEHLRPGVTCGVNGIHFDRSNTWWYHGAKEWCDYLTRCQSLLQTGEHVADALYFHGDEAPGSTIWFSPALPIGYDCDACGLEAFMNLKVKDGRVTLPTGKSYRYLVLPAHGQMTSAMLEKTRSLLQEGATIVGRPVEKTPSLSDALRNDKGRASLISSIWGTSAEKSDDRKCFNGRIIYGKRFEEILAKDNLIQDFRYEKSSGLMLNYIHRTAEGEDCYFIANGVYKEGWATCRFRVDAGMIPEIWNPTDGSISECKIYTTGDGYIEIPLKFAPAGSMFVVFRKGGSKGHEHAVSVSFNGEKTGIDGTTGVPATLSSKNGRTVLTGYVNGDFTICTASGEERSVKIRKASEKDADSKWTVSFPEGWGAPASIELDSLISLSEHPDFGVRHFSGTMSYTNTFTLDGTSLKKNMSVILNLGDVQNIAEVTVNGVSYDAIWTPPFSLDITSALHNGRNDVEIKVTNMWINRMIGDEHFPCDIKYRDGDHLLTEWPDWVLNGTERPEPRRVTFSTIQAWQKDDPLVPSGLIGPVKLVVAENVEL